MILEITKGERIENPFVVLKIWKGLIEQQLVTKDQIERYLGKKGVLAQVYGIEGIYKMVTTFDMQPQYHAIKTDKGKQWKKGTKIHFSQYGRSPDYLQITPVIPCIDVQELRVKWNYKFDKNKVVPTVEIDKKALSEEDLETFASCTGFKNSDRFFNYYTKPYRGKLIHWTREELPY
jgi:hypothetical protein